MNASTSECCKKKNSCEELERERLRYFMGRHLTACDFTDEQAYHVSHRRFHNRMLHGWGVLCGLKVRQHPQPECRDRFVEISPGVAIDCCGREIVVECCASCGEQHLPAIPWDKHSAERPYLLLCLAYLEEKIDPVAVLHNEGDCSNSKSDFGRYSESWKLDWRWASKKDLIKYSWDNRYGLCPAEPTISSPAPPTQQTTQTPNPQAPQEHQQEEHSHPQAAPGEPCSHDDCGDPCEEGFRSCLDPHCPPGHCIPIALVCAQPGQPVTDKQIHLLGRPELPCGPKRLTHIVQINWPHGGIVTPHWFAHHHGRLVVKFDRKLQHQPPQEFPRATGVSEATFMVQFGELFEDLDFVPYEHPPRLKENGCEAEYKIENRRYRHEHYDFLEGHTVWITLRCDFLYDCHGVRVDGNNDGTPGGTFESWLSVVSQEKYAHLKREGQL
jgi:hypothetical protein